MNQHQAHPRSTQALRLQIQVRRLLTQEPLPQIPAPRRLTRVLLLRIRLPTRPRANSRTSVCRKALR